MSNVMDTRNIQALGMDIRETARSGFSVSLSLFMQGRMYPVATAVVELREPGRDVAITWSGLGPQLADDAIDFSIGLTKLAQMARQVHREQNAVQVGARREGVTPEVYCQRYHTREV